jgi:hypothetical protein
MMSPYCRSKFKSLWIVTEVLYARKLAVTVQEGLVNKVMVNASAIAGVPALIPSAQAEMGLRFYNNTTLELTAHPDKQFVVGYRTMRVDCYPDGSFKEREPKDGGLRAEGDDPFETNLELMEEDMFEEDGDGDKVPIPLLTLTEEELDDLISLAANSSEDSEGSPLT